MIPFLRRHLKFIIGLAISAVAVYLSLERVDFRVLWTSFRSANYYFLIPATLVLFGVFFLKAAGWRFLLLPAKKEVRIRSTVSVLVIGLMINNLFPAKMGELVEEEMSALHSSHSFRDKTTGPSSTLAGITSGSRRATIWPNS